MAKTGKLARYSVSDEEFEAMKATHGEGRVCVIETAAIGDVAVRVATDAEWSEYDQLREKDPLIAVENLWAAIALTPAKADVDGIVEAFPGLPMTLITAIRELCGAAPDDEFPWKLNGEGVTITTPHGAFKFRKLKKPELNWASRDIVDAAKRHGATQRICSTTVDPESKVELEQLFAAWPAMVAGVANGVLRVSGIEQNARIRK